LRVPSRLIPVIALLVVTACQAPHASPSPTDPLGSATTTTLPETVTTVSAHEGAVRFGDCLGESGVVIGPVPLDAQGRPRLDLALRDVDLSSRPVVDALDQCAAHLITGALSLEGSPAMREEVASRLAVFSECVRARGVPLFPDPVFGFHGVGFPFPVEEIPYDDPDLVDAIETCRHRTTGD
jgi:hypothetical protein